MSAHLTEAEKKIIIGEKLKGTPSRKIANMIGRGKSTVNYFYNRHLNGGDVLDDSLDDSDIEELCESPDVAIANLAKRLRTAQRTNTQLRRIHNGVFDKGVVDNTYIDAIERAVSRVKVNPTPDIKFPKIVSQKTSQDATLEILFSDLQIGKVGEHYDSKKAVKSLELYGEEIVKYILSKQGGYNIERIIFASLGDIVEDHLKHGVQSAVSTDSGLAEQMANSITHLWEKVLYPIFSLGVKVDVMCIAGNHGSSQHKGMDMYKAGLYSYDFTIYKTLELLTSTAGFKEVNFIIPEGVFGYLNIYGNYAVYEHGYFNTSTEKSMSDQMKKRGQQIKKHVEYFRCGDMHHTCSYDSHRIVLNGAFFGIDEGGTEYSGILGFSSIPSQALILHTEEEKLGRTTAKEFHFNTTSLKGIRKVMSKKVIIFNAPPNSGKDVATEYLVKVLNKEGLTSYHKEFKNYLFKAVKSCYGITESQWEDLYKRENKELPSYFLVSEGVNISPRQALINMSEKVLKPLFGKDVFGKMAAQDLYIGVNVFSDGGFKEEIQCLIDEVGLENVLIIQLAREGCSFKGDSRDYVNDFTEVTVEIENSGKEDFFEIVYREVLVWLDNRGVL